MCTLGTRTCRHTPVQYIMTYCGRWELILQEHKLYCCPASLLYCTQGLETHCTHSRTHIRADSRTVSGKINRDFLPHLSLVPFNQRTHGNTQTHTPVHTDSVSGTLKEMKGSGYLGLERINGDQNTTRSVSKERLHFKTS